MKFPSINTIFQQIIKNITKKPIKDCRSDNIISQKYYHTAKCAWVDNSFHYLCQTDLDKILKIPIMKYAEDIL